MKSRAIKGEWKVPALRIWPDDCPACGQRMEFAFAPRAHRRCTACGFAVQAEECAAVPPKERAH